MLAINRNGRYQGQRIVFRLRVVEAVVRGASNVALHIAGAPHRHRLDVPAPTRFGHVVGLHEVRGELDLAAGSSEWALTTLEHQLERVVRLIDLGANDGMGVELLPSRTLLVTQREHERLVVGPFLERLFVDGLLGIDPVLPLDVLHARVVALDDLVSQALGDLRPHPLAGANLAGEVDTASAEREVVAHAVRSADETLMSVHVLIHALELPHRSGQDDVAHLGGRLVEMPLEAPVELGVCHAAHALVDVGVIVGVVIVEDDHLDMGQRGVVGGRADAMAELVLAHATLPVVVLASEDLGKAVVVEQHRDLVVARIAMPVGPRCRNTTGRGQAGAALAAAGTGDIARHRLQEH